MFAFPRVLGVATLEATRAEATRRGLGWRDLSASYNASPSSYYDAIHRMSAKNRDVVYAFLSEHVLHGEDRTLVPGFVMPVFRGRCCAMYKYDPERLARLLEERDLLCLSCSEFIGDRIGKQVTCVGCSAVFCSDCHARTSADGASAPCPRCRLPVYLPLPANELVRAALPPEGSDAEIALRSSLARVDARADPRAALREVLRDPTLRAATRAAAARAPGTSLCVCVAGAREDAFLAHDVDATASIFGFATRASARTCPTLRGLGGNPDLALAFYELARRVGGRAADRGNPVRAVEFSLEDRERDSPYGSGVFAFGLFLYRGTEPCPPGPGVPFAIAFHDLVDTLVADPLGNLGLVRRSKYADETRPRTRSILAATRGLLPSVLVEEGVRLGAREFLAAEREGRDRTWLGYIAELLGDADLRIVLGSRCERADSPGTAAAASELEKRGLAPSTLHLSRRPSATGGREDGPALRPAASSRGAPKERPAREVPREKVKTRKAEGSAGASEADPTPDPVATSGDGSEIAVEEGMPMVLAPELAEPDGRDGGEALRRDAPGDVETIPPPRPPHRPQRSDRRMTLGEFVRRKDV